MFTGIIIAKGKLQKITRTSRGARLKILSTEINWNDVEIGESISVNGVCLTAVELDAAGVEVDVSMETLRATSLGMLSSGSELNIELSLCIGDRLGGHLVTGHVDCVGEIKSIVEVGESLGFKIELPEGFIRFIASKGSVCIDGVSLTINLVSQDSFEVNIIPHTAKSTIFCNYEIGSKVNIEIDIIARYVERLLFDKNSQKIGIQVD